MTRVFNKGKSKSRSLAGLGGEGKKGESVKVEAPKVEKTRENKGVTLVDDTPVKPRIPLTFGKTKNMLIEPIRLETANSEDNNLIVPMDENQDEEWVMDSSPAVVVFDPMVEKQKDKGNEVLKTADGDDGGDNEWDKKSSLNDRKASSAARSKPLRKRLRKK
jgi:hypothetical protein